MSHDIGTLRAMVKTNTEAWAAVHASQRAIDAAIAETLTEEFGPVERCTERRIFRAGSAAVLVVFDQTRIEWSAMTSFGDEHNRRSADTPRAAVTQAIAALAVTHPTEAAALAAVIPEAP